MKIAALCVHRNSVYRSIQEVECYDIERDARTFPGAMPVIAHPPCRSWSAFCGHQAKPAPGERELALWCVEQVKQWGGILEQPAHSRLWEAADLPVVGYGNEQAFSIEVWQAWWGYPMKKGTWLFFSKIRPESVELPFILHPEDVDRSREQLMSHAERSRTTPAFALWLVNTIRNGLKES